jgi:hypothetical protein
VTWIRKSDRTATVVSTVMGKGRKDLAERTKRQIERPLYSRVAGRACGNWAGKCMAGLGSTYQPKCMAGLGSTYQPPAPLGGLPSDPAKGKGRTECTPSQPAGRPGGF